MSMDPPKVMLERSFLRAVEAAEHPDHARCVSAYRALVSEYAGERVLLVAVGDHLRGFDVGEPPSTSDRVAWFLHRRRVGVFAPVDPLYVGFQHRRAARATDVADLDLALTLVMCDRYKVHRIATLDPEFGEYDLELVALAPVGDSEVREPDEVEQPG